MLGPAWAALKHRGMSGISRSQGAWESLRLFHTPFCPPPSSNSLNPSLPSPYPIQDLFLNVTEIDRTAHTVLELCCLGAGLARLQVHVNQQC